MNDRFRLGHLWMMRGRPHLAIACYQAAARESPGFAAAWVAWAKLAETREAASAIYAEALQHNPDDVGLASSLAQLRNPVVMVEASQPAAPLARREDRRILLYTECPSYGAGEISHSLARAWQAAGIRVTFVQPPTPDRLLAERERLGVRHRFLAPDNLYNLEKTPLAFTNHREARAIFEEERPELVLFADGCPLANLAAKEAASELGLRAAAIVHAVQPEWLRDYAPYLPRLAAQYPRLRDVVAVSQENLSLLRDHFGLSGGRVIHNGRPPIFFEPLDPAARSERRRKLKLADDELLVLTVASLEGRKGYPHLLRCAKKLRGTGIRFAWAGTGSLEAQLREHATGSPIDFLGERDDVAGWLDACDVFLLASEWEGMPLGVLEAMAKGKPILATAVSGIPEALDGTGRLLSDPRIDAERMGNEVVEALLEHKAEPGPALALAKRAQERASQCFRESTMLANYLVWSKEILD